MFKFWSKIAGNSFSPLSTSFMILETEKKHKNICSWLQFSLCLCYNFTTAFLMRVENCFITFVKFEPRLSESLPDTVAFCTWHFSFPTHGIWWIGQIYSLGHQFFIHQKMKICLPSLFFPFFCFSKITCEVIIHFSKLILKLKLYKK